jgi:hypothetical protein
MSITAMPRIRKPAPRIFIEAGARLPAPRIYIEAGGRVPAPHARKHLRALSCERRRQRVAR